jgi:hypothetical protein
MFEYVDHTTLKTASAEQVFNTIAHHLLTQGRKSMNPMADNANGCVYNMVDDEGRTLHCAAGVLIKGFAIREEYNTSGWWKIAQQYPQFSSPNDDLIEKMQDIHDRREVEAWPHLLKSFAETWGITVYDDVLELMGEGI